jgi:hypothetical protein
MPLKNTLQGVLLTTRSKNTHTHKKKKRSGVYYLFVRTEGARNCESKVKWPIYLITHNKLNDGTEILVHQLAKMESSCSVNCE